MKKLFTSVLYLFIFQITTGLAFAEAEAVPLPEPDAASAVLMDADTGIVLFSKGGHEQHYPASVTKVMTALLTLEHCRDLDERINFSRNAVFSLPRNASHIAMDEGETLSVYDALNGLLLSSANEVANALAEHIAGDTEAFADLMNKRAISLGAVNTHFENPTGLHGANHYTTAFDMALIMNAAVKHPVFNDIIAKRRHDIPPTEKQTQYRQLLNTNQAIHPGQFFNEQVTGGKTGFTDEAQHTLLTFAEYGGRSLIASVLGGGRPGTYADTQALLAYGFSLPYENQLVFEGGAYQRSVPVYHGAERIGEITLQGADNVMYLLPEGFGRADIRYEVDLPESVNAPVLLGDALGKVVCFIQDRPIGEVALTATQAMFAPLPYVFETAYGEEETVMALAMAVNEAPLDLYDGVPYAGEPEEGWVFDWYWGYIRPFALPLVLTLIALLISLVLFATRRRKRQAQILRFDKYEKYTGNLYRFKP
jgi:D-alanyl-D-alanine carboxypeptidase